MYLYICIHTCLSVSLALFFYLFLCRGGGGGTEVFGDSCSFKFGSHQTNKDTGNNALHNWARLGQQAGSSHRLTTQTQGGSVLLGVVRKELEKQAKQNRIEESSLSAAKVPTCDANRFVQFRCVPGDAHPPEQREQNNFEEMNKLAGEADVCACLIDAHSPAHNGMG